MKFNSKVQLAEYLKINRGTLYRRAERESVDLDEISTVGLTDEQIDRLRIDGNKLTGAGGTAVDIDQIAQLKQKLAQLTTQNSDLSAQLQATEQKYDNLEDEYKSLNKEYRNKMGEFAERFAQLNDQQQKLTLDVQDKLHAIEAPKKGFWARLFG